MLAGGLCAAVTVARADPGVSAKRAQAQSVLVRLQQLDSSAQRASSLYEAATSKLHQVEHQLAVNHQALGVARVNFRRAQKALSQRLVAIYTSEDQQSSLAVILGAKSLDDLVARIETVNSVSQQDSTLIHEVLGFRHQIVRRRVLLQRDRASQRRLVAARAAAKNRIEGKLAAEQRLYDSVKSQLDRLIEQQHAAQLAAARRARLTVAAQAVVPEANFAPVAGSADLPGDRYSQAASIAMQYLGVPYVWGGDTPAGFDCSGLVMYVYAQLGVSLPHYTVDQWDYANAVSVPRNELEPGDLVFFDGLGHVGIYIGHGEFIHAPHTGAVVSINSLNGWYGETFYGARRILG